MKIALSGDRDLTLDEVKRKARAAFGEARASIWVDTSAPVDRYVLGEFLDGLGPHPATDVHGHTIPASERRQRECARGASWAETFRRAEIKLGRRLPG